MAFVLPPCEFSQSSSKNSCSFIFVISFLVILRSWLSEKPGDSDDSNASDDDFELDEEHVEEEAAQERDTDAAEAKRDGNKEIQMDYFNTNIDEISIRGAESSDNHSVYEDAQEETQFIESDDNHTMTDEDYTPESDEDEDEEVNNCDEEVTTEEINNDDEEITTDNNVTLPRMQNEIKSDLGSCWGDGLAGALMDAEDKAANMLKNYSEMNASIPTQQFGFMKGLKLFGDARYHATVKELQENLIGCNCITMLSKDEITKDIRLKSMGYLRFLKCKRCGKVKARGCVDGRPQRDYILREDCTTPAISLHALMATCLIDALEERKVICIDIPGAFLQVDLEPDENYYVKFTDVMVDMLCKSFPEYKDKIIYGRNGRKYL